MFVLIAACSGPDPEPADRATASSPVDSATDALADTGEVPAATSPIDGEWTAAIATGWGYSTSTSSGGVGYVGYGCTGTLSVAVDAGADPQVTGGLDCGGFLGEQDYDGRIRGSELHLDVVSHLCTNTFVLTYDAGTDTLSGAVGVCEAYCACYDTATVVLVRGG